MSAADSDLPSEAEFVEAFSHFSKKSNSVREILCAVLDASDVHAHFRVDISCIELLQINMLLGNLLLNRPLQLMPLFERALVGEQKTILEQGLCSPGGDGCAASVKENVHVRLGQVPLAPELQKPTISSVRNGDVGRLLSIRGTVIKTGIVKTLVYSKWFECVACRCRMKVFADAEQGYHICAPTSCGNPSCDSSRFCSVDVEAPGLTFQSENQHVIGCDYQEIRIQDQMSQLTMGSIPRSLTVVLMHDLVDSCKPGDDVLVTGAVVRRWHGLPRDGEKVDLDLMLVANNLTVCNEKKLSGHVTDELIAEFEEHWFTWKNKPMTGRNVILRSICPSIFGMSMVKLALALTLIGGVSVELGSHKVRGESHLLLVGDPGCGKSQFLRYAAKLSSRSVLTTGIGTTTAGLTVLAAKDAGGDWSLEAGALVMADGGVCCIDEFSSIREHDRAAIHEAMEQQTLSVAKAGLVCKLNARSSIVAATNPKQKFDPKTSIAVNCAIATPLLSRFDIVLLLLDGKNSEWDRQVSSFILCQRCADDAAAEGRTSGAARPAFWVAGRSCGHAAGPPQANWSVEKLQAYLAWVRTAKHPVLSSGAQDLLSRFYQHQRLLGGSGTAGADVDSGGRTTIRMLESLVRLSQAHARLMWKDRVDVGDAAVAIVVMLQSQTLTGGCVEGVPDVYADFPDDADREHAEQLEAVRCFLATALPRTEWLDHSASSASRLQRGDDHDRSGADADTVLDPLARARVQMAGLFSQHPLDTDLENGIDDSF